jgi:uridine kinase
VSAAGAGERPVDLGRLLASGRPRNGAYPTVVVDGRGASGKSSLGTWLRDQLPGFVVLNGDDYFEPDDDPPAWGGFNEARFDADVLALLRAGRRTLGMRPYSYRLGRVEEPRPVRIVAGVVVERCFGFSLDVDWDVRIWVETPKAVCLARGLERDASDELGDRVRLAWEQVWQPREDDYISQTRPGALADIVLDGTLPFAEQVSVTP